jgi:hypothetical protein
VGASSSVLGDGSGNGEKHCSKPGPTQTLAARSDREQGRPGSSLETNDARKKNTQVESCKLRVVYAPNLAKTRRDPGCAIKVEVGEMVDGGCSPPPKSKIPSLKALIEWVFAQFRLCWSVLALMKPSVGGVSSRQ